MIIKSPTGSYNTVLPKNPNDSNSVIFTISNSNPPRSELSFTQLPVGIAKAEKPAKVYSDDERRADRGKLVIKSEKTYNSTVQGGNKLYEVGAVFDFGFDGTTSDDDVEIVCKFDDSFEARFDQHDIDYSNVGLSDDEIELVTIAGNNTQDLSLGELAGLQKRDRALSNRINKHRRDINDLDRVIYGISATINCSDAIGLELPEGLRDILEKILDTRDGLLNDLSLDILLRGDILDRLLALKDCISDISNIVR